MSKLFERIEKDASMADTLNTAKNQAGDLISKGVAGIKANPRVAAGVAGAGVAGGALLKKVMAPKSVADQALAVAKKNPKVTAALAALGIGAGVAGAVKSASEVAYENMQFAKQAAEELATESLNKLAFAEQLYKEANYVTESLTKEASEIEDIDTDGSALEAFLQELDVSESE